MLLQPDRVAEKWAIGNTYKEKQEGKPDGGGSCKGCPYFEAERLLFRLFDEGRDRNGEESSKSDDEVENIRVGKYIEDAATSGITSTNPAILALALAVSDKLSS